MSSLREEMRKLLKYHFKSPPDGGEKRREGSESRKLVEIRSDRPTVSTIQVQNST